MGTINIANTDRELLIAKRDYHNAKAEYYEALMSLEEAQTGLVDSRGNSQETPSTLIGQQALIADCEDEVVRAHSVVSLASLKVERLVRARQQQLAANIKQIATDLFDPGTGLMDIISIGDEEIEHVLPSLAKLLDDLLRPINNKNTHKPAVNPDQPAG